MADQKANIMIAATSILLTFSFANFKQQNLFWGFLALFVFSFVALILAILALIPRVVRPDGNRRNLLFFGDFTEMSMDDYHTAMEEVLGSDKNIYEAIVTDIHALGGSLKDRKFHFLGLSYRWFLAGVVIAGALFLLQTALFYFT